MYIWGLAESVFIGIETLMRIWWLEACGWYCGISWDTLHCPFLILWLLLFHYLVVLLLYFKCDTNIHLSHIAHVYWSCYGRDFTLYIWPVTPWEILVDDLRHPRVLSCSFSSINVYTPLQWSRMHVYGLRHPRVLSGNFISLDVYIDPATVVIPPRTWLVMPLYSYIPFALHHWLHLLSLIVLILGCVCMVY